jgi:hypothetical protein
MVKEETETGYVRNTIAINFQQRGNKQSSTNTRQILNQHSVDSLATSSSGHQSPRAFATLVLISRSTESPNVTLRHHPTTLTNKDFPIWKHVADYK